MSQLDDQMRRAEAYVNDAAKDASSPEEAVEKGLRAALDYALQKMPTDLGNLERALGVKLDAGSFLLGMQALSFTLNEMDFVQLMEQPLLRELFLEYVDGAREACK